MADLVIADGKVVKSVHGDGFFKTEVIDDPAELIDLVRDLIARLSSKDPETDADKSEVETAAYVTLGKLNDLWKAVGAQKGR
jgi:hypothetical protein